jgi:hypothetical protein
VGLRSGRAKASEKKRKGLRRGEVVDDTRRDREGWGTWKLSRRANVSARSMSSSGSVSKPGDGGRPRL